MTNNFNTDTKITLASNSKFRATLLRNAGIEFETRSADIDERAIEVPLIEAKLDAADVAQVLAEAKAQDVSSRMRSSIIIGCDQTLSIHGQLFHKPADMVEARRQLLNFSGKTHQLNSAVTLVYNEQTIWRHVSIANMTVRKLSPEYIGRYLARVGNDVLSSVGAYQFEGEGVHLFKQIDGDYFTIIGLPLLPLLGQLRTLAVIDG